MAVSNSTDRFNGVLASKAIKVPVKRATNVNQVLSGNPGPIDGWAWSDGDRILLYGQTNPVENGIWEVNLSSAWRRAADFDGTRDATESTLITAGRSGSLNPLMYVLTTDNNPIRIGTDALAFQIYFDPDNPAAAGLQAVTDVGNTTTNDIIINPAVANQPNLIISNAGRIQLANTSADGDITFGFAAPTGAQIDANGIVDLFQFTGFDEFRILGTGAPAGAVLVMGERDEIANPLPGPLAAFGTIWIRDDAPNVLVFTDDAGTDWVLNVVDTLQSVTDNGNTTTNNIELVGTNLLLDDAGEVQFGTVAGGEINIRYDAANNELEFYDASATNTGVRVGAGINNFFVNPEQNANAVVTIGEPSTLRGNAQQAIFNMYGEDTGVLHLAQVQNTGALYWHNAPTLPIQFTGTDFLMDTVNARIRGVVANFAEEKRLFFEDSLGNVHAYIGPQSNQDYELRNLAQDKSIRIVSTLTGGSVHTALEHNQNSSTYLAANAGRDVELRVGTATFIRCDNLGATDVFYAGSQNVARFVSESGGGLLVSQTDTGATNTLRRVLTTYDLGQDAEFWFYDFNSNIMGDPTQARFRINNADPTLVTAIAVDDLTISERDIAGILSAIQAGTVLQIAQTTDLGVWFSYTATGPATDNTGWWEIPVTYVAHGGTHNGVNRDPFKFSFSNLTSAPAAAGGGGFDSFNYTYDSNTATANPGDGNIRFNNAIPASASRFMISGTDGDGNNLNALMDDCWIGVFGIEFRMVKADDPSVYVIGSINSTSDQGVWHNPYINWVESNGTFTNGDAVRVQISSRAHVNRPTVDHGLYIGNATLSGQPRCGAVQTSLLRHDPSSGAATLGFYDGGPVNFSVNNGSTDITGSAIFQIRASNRFEIYGSGNTLPRFNVTESVVSVGHANDVGNGAPQFYLRERTSLTAPGIGWGGIAVLNSTPNQLWFIDDANNTYNLTNPGASAQTITTGWSTGSGGSLTLAANAPLFYTEQATDDTPAAGQGQVWVRNDTPNTLMFTDDAGTDFVIGGSLAGGIGGSIADNQIAVGAATANDIEGDANLTWNGTVLALGGAGKQLLLNGPETVPGAPTIGFGAGGDTGFYERGPDILAVSVGGTEQFNWNGAAFHSALSEGGGILNETASATNPTLIPRRATVATGIGANSADELSVICGGVEMVRFVEATDDYAQFQTPILISESAAAVGDIAAYGQLWVRSDAPNTLMFTDDAGNDFAVPKRQIKAKSADETVNNSSTYQADNHLTGFNLEAGKYYRVEALLRITAGATPDIKIDLVFTNATQLGHKFTSTIAPGSSVQAPTAIETEQVINGDTGLRMIQLEGFFQANATTGGTMELQWAQNTATVEDTTIHEGSFMVIEQTEA